MIESSLADQFLESAREHDTHMGDELLPEHLSAEMIHLAEFYGHSDIEVISAIRFSDGSIIVAPAGHADTWILVDHSMKGNS